MVKNDEKKIDVEVVFPSLVPSVLVSKGTNKSEPIKDVKDQARG